MLVLAQRGVPRWSWRPPTRARQRGRVARAAPRWLLSRPPQRTAQSGLPVARKYTDACAHVCVCQRLPRLDARGERARGDRAFADKRKLDRRRAGIALLSVGQQRWWPACMNGLASPRAVSTQRPRRRMPCPVRSNLRSTGAGAGAGAGTSITGATIGAGARPASTDPAGRGWLASDCDCDNDRAS